MPGRCIRRLDSGCKRCCESEGTDQSYIFFLIDGIVFFLGLWCTLTWDQWNIKLVVDPKIDLIYMSQESNALVFKETGGCLKPLFCDLTPYRTTLGMQEPDGT